MVDSYILLAYLRIILLIMEKITLLIILCSIPSIFFMLIAKVNGNNKWFTHLFIKLPAFIAAVLIVVYFLKLSNLI
jgi:hypothetical protein